MGVCTYVSSCARMYVCMYVRTYVGMYVCMYVYMYLWLCMCMYICSPYVYIYVIICIPYVLTVRHFKSTIYNDIPHNPVTGVRALALRAHERRGVTPGESRRRLDTKASEQNRLVTVPLQSSLRVPVPIEVVSGFVEGLAMIRRQFWGVFQQSSKIKETRQRVSIAEHAGLCISSWAGNPKELCQKGCRSLGLRIRVSKFQGFLRVGAGFANRKGLEFLDQPGCICARSA